MKDKIKRLEEIRMEITKIYMELGNLKELEADSILSKDISILENKFKEEESCCDMDAKHNSEEKRE